MKIEFYANLCFFLRFLVHDFYSSHMHQNHMPLSHHSHQGQITPPHQIHNPTPAYHHPNYTSSSLTGGNTSPHTAEVFHHSSHHTAGHQQLSNDHSLSHHALHNMHQHQAHHQQHQQQIQQQQLRNDISPNELAYGVNQHNAQANLPPTPNSIVTMVGPNSGNSTNSNAADGSPSNTEHSPVNATSTLNTNNNHLSALTTMAEPLSLQQPTSSAITSNYSPWTSVVSRPSMAQLSPGDNHPNTCVPQMPVQPMHHHHHHHMPTGLPTLHHHSSAAMGNGGAAAAAYMHPQSLPNFGHSPAKGFAMTPQPYYWY